MPPNPSPFAWLVIAIEHDVILDLRERIGSSSKRQQRTRQTFISDLFIRNKTDTLRLKSFRVVSSLTFTVTSSGVKVSSSSSDAFNAFRKWSIRL